MFYGSWTFVNHIHLFSGIYLNYHTDQYVLRVVVVVVTAQLMVWAVSRKFDPPLSAALGLMGLYVQKYFL